MNRKSGGKYTPIQQNQSKNPFDDDLTDPVATPAVRSNNPFDEEVALPPLPPRSTRSTNPFDDDSFQSTSDNSYNPVLAPQNLSSQQHRLPIPPPRQANRSKLNLPKQERTPSLNTSERMQQPSPDRASFRQKLTKVDQKLQKDKYDQISEVCYDPSNENAIVRFLVAKRVFGYPGTNGGVFSNYRHYVYNNHPLLSIFCLHPLNPFGRKDRFVVFMNSLFFAIFITFLITETTFVPRLSTCRLPCNPFTAPNTTTTICQGGYNDGLSYDEYQKACSYYSPWMLTAICGICIVVYQSMLEFLATCGCMQGKKSFQNNCCGSRIKRCIEGFGGCLLSMASVVSTTFLLWAIIACYLLGIGYGILANIVLSKVWSIGQWFVWSAPYFAYRYPLDRKHFYQRLLRKEGKKGSTETTSTTSPPSPAAVSVEMENMARV